MHKKTQSIIKIKGDEFDASSGQRLTLINNDSSIAGQPSSQDIGVLKTRTQNILKIHTEHTKTLMRHAVSKPRVKLSRIAAVSSPADLMPNGQLINHPVIAGKPDPLILKRARTIAKSKRISRFGAAVKSNRSVKLHQATIANSDIRPNNVKPSTKTPLDKLLDEAVKNARAHEQPKLSRKEIKQIAWRGRHKRKTALMASIFMGLVVIGYAVYVNIPNFMVKFASVRAGFSAVLPSYKPTGYTLTAVSYRPGLITMQFEGNPNTKRYSLTEQSSNWDSAVLVNSIIRPFQGSNYQKLVINGQGIYLYGNDQAAWVAKGIWFRVNGNGNLDSSQLVQLARRL